MAPQVAEPKEKRRSRLRRGEAPHVETQTRAEVQESIYQMFRPSQLRISNIDWVTLLWMVGIHAGCLAAPFYFSWTALGAAVFLHWFTASIGICLCYHRFLSHRSFKLKGPAKFIALLAGTLAGEGSAYRWTATHRLHHQRSDQDGDPHSPTKGAFWSHMLWIFVYRSSKQDEVIYKRYIPELLDDKMIRFFDKGFTYILFGSAILLTLIGGLPFLVWAVCVRMTVAYHSTWLINSASHMWGYRTYETRDHSRNLWWAAILSYGEGWHNNHHAHPVCATYSHRWWEIDLTWYSIQILRSIGQCYDVKDKVPSASTPIEG